MSRDRWQLCPESRHCPRYQVKPQVIPEAAGPVKSVGRPVSCPRPGRVGAPMRRHGQGLGRSPTAQRPEALEDVAVRRIMFAMSGTCSLKVNSSGGCGTWWTWLASAPVCPGGAGGWLLGHPFEAPDAQVSSGPHDGVRQSGRSGQSAGSTTPPRLPRVGVMTCTTRDRPENLDRKGRTHAAARGGCSARTWWSRSA